MNSPIILNADVGIADNLRTLVNQAVLSSFQRGKNVIGQSKANPYNPATGKVYRGLNALWLSLQPYTDPRWLTYEQAETQEWTLCDRALATHIADDSNSHRSTVALYNAEQFEIVPPLRRASSFTSEHAIKKAHIILRSSGARTYHVRDSASFFCPLRDEIHLPLREQFEDDSDYYSTALLQLCHWTGHCDRLNRSYGSVGDEAHVLEDLLAHVSSWMIACELGISAVAPSYESIRGWGEILAQDDSCLDTVFRDAESICNYLLHSDHYATERDRASILQALDAQVLIERIADAKEPSIELILDINAYLEAYEGANDKMSFLIERAVADLTRWSEVRGEAKKLLDGQSAPGLALEQDLANNVATRERDDNDRHTVDSGKPFLVQREPRGSAMDQLIIRGSDTVLEDQFSDQNPRFTEKAVIERVQGFAFDKPPGSSSQLNDLVLPLDSKNEASKADHSPDTDDILDRTRAEQYVRRSIHPTLEHKRSGRRMPDYER